MQLQARALNGSTDYFALNHYTTTWVARLLAWTLHQAMWLQRISSTEARCVAWLAGMSTISTEARRRMGGATLLRRPMGQTARPLATGRSRTGSGLCRGASAAC